jgi:S-formylglutathione hydrolase FrmB
MGARVEPIMLRRQLPQAALVVGSAVALALGASSPAAAKAPVDADAQAARAAVAAACAKARARAERAFEVRFPSSLLAENVQGNSGEARAVIRQPLADCRAQPGRCWLLVYLPGFDADPAAALADSGLGGRLDALERSGATPPIAAAAVDGRTRLGGGFYVDSPSSGRIASLILDALLPALRTALGADLPRERTVILGHSMGGYGALSLALARPEAFSGVGALSPAVHVEAQAQRLVAWLQAGHPRSAPDPTATARAPDPAPFLERLLWALCAAFDPAPIAPQGFRLPFDPASRPWRLTPSARAALARADLASGWNEHRKAAARAWSRAFVASGRRDSLVPPSDVEPMAEALRTARDGAPTRVNLHDGDHVSRLGADFEDAVRFLTAIP